MPTVWVGLYTQEKLSICQIRLVETGKYRPYPEHFTHFLTLCTGQSPPESLVYGPYQRDCLVVGI